MILRHIVLALSLALAGAVHASDCPNLIAKVDAALAEKPELDKETMDEIATLRADGEKLHADGKHEKSVEALTQALLLLGKM